MWGRDGRQGHRQRRAEPEMARVGCVWDHDANGANHRRAVAMQSGTRAWPSRVGEASEQGSVSAFTDVHVHGKHHAAVAAAAHGAHAVCMPVSSRPPIRIGRPGCAHVGLSLSRHKPDLRPSHCRQDRVRALEADTPSCLCVLSARSLGGRQLCARRQRGSRDAPAESHPATPQTPASSASHTACRRHDCDRAAASMRRVRGAGAQRADVPRGR